MLLGPRTLRSVQRRGAGAASCDLPGSSMSVLPQPPSVTRTHWGSRRSAAAPPWRRLRQRRIAQGRPGDSPTQPASGTAVQWWRAVHHRPSRWCRAVSMVRTSAPSVGSGTAKGFSSAPGQPTAGTATPVVPHEAKPCWSTGTCVGAIGSRISAKVPARRVAASADADAPEHGPRARCARVVGAVRRHTARARHEPGTARLRVSRSATSRCCRVPRRRSRSTAASSEPCAH